MTIPIWGYVIIAIVSFIAGFLTYRLTHLDRVKSVKAAKADIDSALKEAQELKGQAEKLADEVREVLTKQKEEE